MKPDDHWHQSYAQAWGKLEHKWASLVGLVSGIVIGLLLVLIFAALPVAFTVILAGLVWVSVGLLVWFGHQAAHCRQWREYHDALAANPVLWPWPHRPGDWDA